MSREAFEKWVKEEFYYTPINSETLWEVWQAAQAQAVNQQLLEADLDEAVQLLADWAVAVRDNGASWDYWDDHYKNVMYGKGRLRERLDTAIAAAQETEK